VITTHMLEMFEQGMLKDTSTPTGLLPGLRSFTMAVMANENGNKDTVVPLFTLQPDDQQDKNLSSNAISCAILGGVPDDVIARAKVVHKSLTSGRPITPMPWGSNKDAHAEAHIKKIMALWNTVPDWSTCDSSRITQLIGMLKTIPAAT
jgi:DNA mismatch repair ATPase MutS